MTLQISIGYSKHHDLDFRVLEHSIRSKSSIPLDVRKVPEHEEFLSRPRTPEQTTAFSFTRFLTPYVWDYKGFSVYMDPDMLCLCDIKELYDLIDPTKIVQVVRHDYQPKMVEKYCGRESKPQLSYGRKNWSSLIIFNNELCRDIYTLMYVDMCTGLALHKFANLQDNEIGALPKPFNYLVGEDNQEGPAKIAHFTNGMPYVHDYKECDYAREWFAELDDTFR